MTSGKTIRASETEEGPHHCQKNETGWLAIIVVDGKQKLAVPFRKEAQGERYR